MSGTTISNYWELRFGEEVSSYSPATAVRKRSSRPPYKLLRLSCVTFARVGMQSVWKRSDEAIVVQKFSSDPLLDSVVCKQKKDCTFFSYSI